ncbi:polysaccharide pyruvyl transferase family protein [Pannonibacter sp.]|uniref:polysaccharide pyruvyl transferase family protein n=1 Tax=Pannonibacter sp. TaxID=1906786 RepID=UPI003F719A29
MVKKILVIHAYSRRNSGDGLLVDATTRIIHEAFGATSDIRYLCMDADSFSDLSNNIQLASTSTNFIERISGSFKSVIQYFTHKPLIFPIPVHDIDLIVAVGGGYMRSISAFQSLKAMIAHGAQLRCAVSSNRPTVYLSQSAGPFHCVSGRLMRSDLQKVSLLCLRDDRSMEQVGGSNCVRTPDLAVFAIARSIGTSTAQMRTEDVMFIGRKLNGSSRRQNFYEMKLKSCFHQVENAYLAVQSKGRGNDDPAFYRDVFGEIHAPDVRHVLESDKKPAACVSVRLHGALESILQGVPTVHLSYERKGFGAYQDLGISEFVHNVYDFDVETVVRQISQLRADPDSFWRKIQNNKGILEEKYSEFISRIREIV